MLDTKLLIINIIERYDVIYVSFSDSYFYKNFKNNRNNFSNKVCNNSKNLNLEFTFKCLIKIYMIIEPFFHFRNNWNFFDIKTVERKITYIKEVTRNHLTDFLLDNIAEGIIIEICSSNAAVPWDLRTGSWASGIRTRRSLGTAASYLTAAARRRRYFAGKGIIPPIFNTRYVCRGFTSFSSFPRLIIRRDISPRIENASRSIYVYSFGSGIVTSDIWHCRKMTKS